MSYIFDIRTQLAAVAFGLGVLLGTPTVSVFAQAQNPGRIPSPPGAAAYFVDLKDGATIPPKTVIHFGLRNMEVAPAGSDQPNSGHHHLLIDTELPALDRPIPNDFNHLHFGKGQTEAEVSLSPGEHTLQLILGDKNHVPHDPPVVSERIKVNVAEAPATVAQAQNPGRIPSPPGAAAYFVDLKDGATIPPKTVIHFGLRNMEVAPAGSDQPNSGHHHLLIDTEQPALDRPIPNDFNHLHFGKGQTEAEVSLSPGEHTLQLILGDKNHVPHDPPVVSERIRVNVAEAPATVAQVPAYSRKPSPPGARVYIAFPTNGSVVPRSVTVHFGLTGMGVAPAGVDKANTGHHHLLIDVPLPPLDQPIPNDFNHLHFGLGQTEANVKLPLGIHTLQLILGDARHYPHNPPIISKRIKVFVTVSGKRPRPRTYLHPRRRKAL